MAQPALDKLGGDPNSGTIGYKELKEITTIVLIEDIWRKKHNDKLFTWNNKDFSQRSRIDRWYISTEWSVLGSQCRRSNYYPKKAETERKNNMENEHKDPKRQTI